MKMPPRLFGGVRMLGSGPCPENIRRMDSNVVPLVIRMMQTGMLVDLDHFASMEKTLVDDMDSITESVHKLTGHYINLNSGDQKSDLLFKRLKIKQVRPKMTPSGDRESVDDEILLAIQHEHPVVPLMLNHAELSKLLGTYVRPMPKLARHVGFNEWRMFPWLSQTRVLSGRFNAKAPNLLAIPSRTERGREIRNGFITKTGWKYVSVDFSQIEPRVAAHCSEDSNLCNVYFNDEDVYSDFAITAFKLLDNRYKDPESGKWKYPSVDPWAHRRPSKILILAAIYDITAAGLLSQMPIICAGCNLESTKHTCANFRSLWTENKCQDLLNAFYMRYPGILKDRKRTHAIARKHGYMFDMWGRILHTTAVRSVLEWVVSGALREAGNFPYQAGACGIFKLALAQVDADLDSIPGMFDLVHLALPIHDELLCECQEDMVEELSELIRYRFETVCKLRVPIKAGVAVADKWGLAK